MKWILLFLIGGYAALCALMYFAQRGLLYFPDTRYSAPQNSGLPDFKEEKLVTADGETIIVWHMAPRDADKPVIIYFHGNGGALNLRAERFAALALEGFGIVGVSYRGYGGSSGTPSEQGLITDGVAAYEFAVKRYTPARIALWGESLGSAVAIAVASEAPVAKIVLESPFTSVADLAASLYWFVPVRLLIKDPFRSDRRIANVKAPILIMHGVKDDIVPIRYGEGLYALIKGEKKFHRLAEGGHNDLGRYGALKVAAEFLSAK
jgi:fermentation-respiration switch protein FrsA (DUF1100 family)